MDIKLERFKDIELELMPLVENHFNEVAHFPEIPLDLDVALYRAMDESGSLKCFTLRNKSQSLLGYSILFVRPNPHRKGSFQASEDLIYVSPSHRGMGRVLVEHTEIELARIGVEVIYRTATLKNGFAKTLRQNHYELIDLVYGKKLYALGEG